MIASGPLYSMYVYMFSFFDLILQAALHGHKCIRGVHLHGNMLMSGVHRHVHGTQKCMTKESSVTYWFINRKFPYYNIIISIMLTNRMPSVSLLAAGSFILRLHLTNPSTQTAKSTTLTTPATTPPKKVPKPRRALSVAVRMQARTIQVKYMKHNSIQKVL